MAALSGSTAVKPTPNTQIQRVVYGATVTVGQPIYKDLTDDNKWKPADSNTGTSDAAEARGIAMTPGVAGESGIIAIGGSIILFGTTMIVGQSYYAGQTAGSIVPVTDLATGDFVSIIGVAETATQMLLILNPTRVQRA